MTLLEALIEYGVSQNILVGDGEDSFRDFMPEEPASVVTFAEYVGNPVSVHIDCVHRSVQVKVRDKDAEAARSKAVQLMSIFKADNESLRIDFSDTLWGQVYIRQTPFKIKQDESNRVTYCFNLGITTNILE
jgi:hypothetical protein